MAFPPVGYAQPSLQLRQLSFNGLTFGGNVVGDPYQIINATGLFGIPKTLAGDVQRDLDQGEFLGLDVLPGRDPLIQVIVKADGTSFDHARQALGQAFAVAGNVEQPLFVQLDSGLYACMARPRGYDATYDLTAEQAQACIATMLLHSTDPRWYAQPSKTTTLAHGATATVTNGGRVEMRPIFVISGPCVNPLIRNSTINGAPFVQWNVTLSTGDTLTIDTQAKSAVYLASGQTIGSSVGPPTALSTWWNLQPGGNSLTFTAAAGSLAVQYADAYLAI